MEIKNKIKEFLPYIGVTLAIILPWLFYPGYLFFTDFVLGPNINLDCSNSFFIINLIIISFSFIFSIDFLEKLFIGLIIFIILLASRKIISHFIKDKFAIFVVSLFALFNPFIYDRMMYGQMGIALAFGFFLFAIGYLLKYLDNREGRQMIYFGICAGFSLQFSVHFVFFIGIVSLFYLVLYFKRWKLNRWRSFVKYVFFAGVLCMLLNINWIASGLLSKNNTINFLDSGITKQDLSAFKTAGSSDSQVLSNVLMMSGFWGKDQYRYTDLTKIKENWGRSFLFILPVILLGLFFGVKKKETRFLSIGLLIIFIASVILACGINFSHLQNFTYWLFEHIPLYKGLRETQKWVSVLVLIYTVFLSIGVTALLKTKIVLVHKNFLLIFLGAVIIMQAPFLLWGFWGQVKPVSYPTDWQAVDKELKCEKGGKILFLPWHLYMSFNWVGKIIANPAKGFFTCPVISSSAMEWGGIYDNSQNNDSEKVFEWLNKKGENDLLKNNELGIKYILLAKELDWGNYLWLEKTVRVKLIDETLTLKVYEIQ